MRHLVLHFGAGSLLQSGVFRYMVVYFRSLCSRCGRSDNAPLLSVWRHGEHRLSHGVQWSA